MGMQRETSRATSAFSGWDSLLRPGTRNVLFVCCTLQALQQLCGVNAIVFFTPTILRGAGAPQLFRGWGVSDNVAAMMATILAYLPKLPTTVLAGFLIESWGRRQLLVRFIPALAFCLAALAASFGGSSVTSAAVATAAVTLFGVFFGLSLGPLPNIISAELFPTRSRSAGVAASTGVQFACNALVAATFPVLTAAIGTRATLCSFAAFSSAAWLFVLRSVPETKGISLEEIGSAVEGKQD